MLTQEEIQSVKDTGLCHEVTLAWSKLDVGVVEYVDDVKVNSILKLNVATCASCGTEFRKSRDEPPPPEPVIVNLDEV